MKTNQSFAIFGFLLLLLSSCSNQQTTVAFVQPTAYSASSVADYFPLSRGAYWIYEGNVRWQVGQDQFERIVQWKMEVVDVVQRINTTGFRMQGAPWDLAWYENGMRPSEYSFIKVGSSRFYKGSIEDYERLLDETDFLGDLVHEYSLFLDIPLTNGERFCDTSSIARDDTYHCWGVGGETQIQLANVIGIETPTLMTEFVVAESTLSDFSVFHFVPGIGITQYKYVHHGTVSEADIKLIEYHAGH